MQVIDRTRLHARRIFAPAQRRCDAWHHARRNAADPAGGCAMNVATEHGDDPSVALQSITQPRQAFGCLEVKAIRPDRHLERRMVRENDDRLVRLGTDQLDQMVHLLTAKIAAAVPGTKCVQCNQSHRIALDQIVMKS